MARLRLACAAFALGLCVSCGGGDQGDDVGVGDTNTNWLRQCDEDAQCGDQYSCRCGVCTVTCRVDADCDGRPLEAVCVSRPKTCEAATPICLPPDEAPTDAGSASPDGTGGAANPAPSATDVPSVVPDGGTGGGSGVQGPVDGTVEWSTQLDGDSNEANGVALDASGVYVAGQMQGADQASPDAFLALYTPTGDLAWSKPFGSDGRDWANDVAVGPDGTVFAVGLTEGALNGTTENEADSGDGFVVAFDADGVEKWTHLVATADRDLAQGVAVDAGGSAFVTGLLGSGGATLPRAFVAKYTAAGQAWLRELGEGIDGSTSGKGIVAAPGDDTVTVVGSTEESLDGDNQGLADAFVAQYSSDGDLLWVHQFGSTEGDTAEAVGVDANGNLYVVGESYGRFEGSSAGGADAFLVKFSSSGDQLWVQEVATPLDDLGVAVALDSGGNVFVAGSTAGAVVDTNLGRSDAFAVEFSPDGELVWQKQFGSSELDDGTGVVADADGSILVAGVTHGDFGGTAPALGTTRSFIARLR